MRDKAEWPEQATTSAFGQSGPDRKHGRSVGIFRDNAIRIAEVESEKNRLAAQTEQAARPVSGNWPHGWKPRSRTSPTA
jgi:hypothetical protein